MLLNNLTTEQQFFDDICKAITDIGGFKLAWIGMLEDTTVKFSAYSGSSAEYLKGISVTLIPFLKVEAYTFKLKKPPTSPKEEREEPKPVF